MSIHPSLSSSKKNKKLGSVLKRIERLRIMLEKGEWKEGDEVFGLPKIKTIRIKIKKEKAAKTETPVAEGVATTAETTAKAQPAAKGTSPKQEKK